MIPSILSKKYFQKKTQGKSVEFVLTHQYKSLESIPTVIGKSDSTIILKAAITKKGTKNPCANAIDKQDGCFKEPPFSLKNHNSSLKKKSKEQHLLTCNKSASLTKNCHSASTSARQNSNSKCEHSGHGKCSNSVHHTDHLQSHVDHKRRLHRNNSCSSDRGARYRSHSASSSTSYVSRSLDHNPTVSNTSLDSNDLDSNDSEQSINDCIAYAQILLEAIGNASTQINNNSSRFVSNQR